MIAPNIIIMFPGNEADIPDGFVRDTSLDGKYAKSINAGNPGDSGGAATHTHTSPNHQHAIEAHTHTYTSSVSGGGGQAQGTSNGVADNQHTHTGTTGAAVISSTYNAAVTYGTVSNDPPYFDVIFIKSVGYNQIPDGAIVYFGADVPAGFVQHSASIGKYFKGALSDGGSTGGSVTNVHDISHTHNVNSHGHVTQNSNTTSSSGHETNNSTDIGAIYSHVHPAVVTSSTQQITAYSGNLTTTETVEPTYKKLMAIQADGKQLLKEGIVCLWTGSLLAIPTGWVLCDGNNGTQDLRDKYIKNATDYTEVGDTGGANTHTHAAQAHAHTGSGTHNHAIALTQFVGNKNKTGTGYYVAETHTHTATGSNVTANYENADTTADSSANEPQYVTVAYIMATKSALGGTASIMSLFL